MAFHPHRINIFHITDVVIVITNIDKLTNSTMNGDDAVDVNLHIARSFSK